MTVLSDMGLKRAVEEVMVRSKWGEVRYGTAHLSPGRGKTTVNVTFDPPLVLGWPTMGQTSNAEEFSLLSGCRYVWGQGNADDVDDWTLDKKDQLRIYKEGGG